MPKGSFEEELNRKISGFLLSPKQDLWESVESALLPEKRCRGMAWLWLPVGLLLIGGFAYWYNSKPVVKELAISNPDAVKESMTDQNISGTGKAQPKEAGIAMNKALRKRKIVEWKPFVTDKSKKHSRSKVIKQPSDEIRKDNGVNNNRILVLKDKYFVSMKPVKKTKGGIIGAIVPSAAETVIVEDTALKIADALPPGDTAKTNPDIRATTEVHTAYIGFVIMPLSSGAALALNSRDAQSAMAYNNRKGTDKNAIGLNIGLTAGLGRKRHYFYAGVQYQSIGYQLLAKNIEMKTPGSGSATVNGYKLVATDSFSITDKGNGAQYVTNRYHFLSIPVGYTYQLITRPYFSMGITGNFAYNGLLGSNALLYDAQSGYYLKQNGSNEGNLCKSNFMLGTGIEIGYRLNDLYALTLRPQYGFTLSPVEKAAISTGIRYWGIGTGVKFYLK